MSIRSRATQYLGKQFQDKPHSCPPKPTSQWPGHHGWWHEEQQSSKLPQTSSGAVASVTSERMFRSRETVEAWLEKTSPTSVLDTLDDENPSSSDFLNSSPSGWDHSSCATWFQTLDSKTSKAAHSRSRTISPPSKSAANRNSEDVSRIDAEHYSTGGSFLSTALKNARYSDFPSPPAFKQTNDHHENFNSEECGSPRSEFSLTFEWKHILAAGNAAGMSTRDPSASNFDYKARNGASNVSDADSDISNLGVLPQVVRRKPRRNWSMELPRVARILNRSGSGDLKDMWVDDKKTRTGAIYGPTPLQRLYRRTSEQEAFEQVRSPQPYIAPQNHMKHKRKEKEIKSLEDHQRAKAATAVKQPESPGLKEKFYNSMSMAGRKSEDRITAEAKVLERAVRGGAMDSKSLRRTSKVPRTCLPLY